ncbi:hypothetical protein M5K25_002435 [Dendrobium thyrsiflorum]|uniref:Endonuclease/exonuclease/phosphatase domain-containing protein n=1 Tax=Dendrobium thyrsiflorum TaxID=117978 RepID=A0ABD0VN62_DENTH
MVSDTVEVKLKLEAETSVSEEVVILKNEMKNSEAIIPQKKYVTGYNSANISFNQNSEIKMSSRSSRFVKCNEIISSSSVKQKRNKELKSLGPIEATPRKRKGDVNMSHGGGEVFPISPLWVVSLTCSPEVALVLFFCLSQKREASLYLREIVKDNNVFFIGLLETKLSNIDRREVNRIIGEDWNFFHHLGVGTLGGILVLWNRNEVSFEVLENSSQLVFGSIQIPNMGIWNFSTIYGIKDLHIRRGLWDSIERLSPSNISFIVGGDFNCILSKEDKIEGKRFIFSQGPDQEMKSFMVNNDFHDVGVIGPRFTWCNNKEGTSRIWERLDRCLLNSSAIQCVPFSMIRHLARVASDHSPFIFKICDIPHPLKKFIQFEDVWKCYTAAWNVVLKSWRKSDFGDDVEILQEKNKEIFEGSLFLE